MPALDFRASALLAFLLTGCLLLAPGAGRAADRCTAAADQSLSDVGSWADLYRWFKRYEDCDDAPLTAGVSRYVTTSLAGEWRDLGRLERQIRKDDRFKVFVLRHIDGTADPGHLAAIVENATRRCPEGSSDLCISLIKHALEAQEEAP